MKESETGRDTAHTESISHQTPEDAEPMLYCPVCSARLTERKCKLVCLQCGYYLSCADYY